MCKTGQQILITAPTFQTFHTVFLIFFNFGLKLNWSGKTHYCSTVLVKLWFTEIVTECLSAFISGRVFHENSKDGTCIFERQEYEGQYNV